ncbi:MAG: MmcQ/YjbR family DNA-binding protein [Zavarzinella sp.]|nr:MmcQ/YjbR family DNA-binding protein [Zavarzinella sp.]
MTAGDFRALALSLPEAVESAHMDHPDFRVRGKIFATLGPDETWGMVKLTPDQQKLFVRTEPAVFEPVAGRWGRRGATRVRLEAATEPAVRQALIAAWRNTAPKRLAKQLEDESSTAT